tara:strand:- start:413 stop:1399 length:987 start_codon:yes stop_codon:yes gene_type:complete
MKRLFFIFPQFKDTITGGTYYDHEVSRYLKKLHVPLKKIMVSECISSIKLSCLLKNIPKKSTILIDGYLANKISFLFHHNFHILIHHPCCLERREGKMSNLNLYFNEKKAFSKCKSIITVSNYMKKVINSISYRIVKIVVAYPGIDNSYYLKKRDINAKNILTIGNVIERKGYNVLIEALAQINSDWQLNIIGKFSSNDPYYQALTKKIQKYRLSNNIRFLGNISENSKMKIMLDSKIFVLPTFYEGFGISLVEATALGLKIVTSDLPVLREVLKGSQSQFIPINDAKKLSAAIENKLHETSELSSNKIKHYNWRSTAKTFKRALYVN